MARHIGKKERKKLRAVLRAPGARAGGGHAVTVRVQCRVTERQRTCSNASMTSSGLGHDAGSRRTTWPSIGWNIDDVTD